MIFLQQSERYILIWEPKSEKVWKETDSNDTQNGFLITCLS